jgi:hypothetical protein
MEDGGLMSWYLGINVIFNKNGSISFDQHQYLQEKLEEFKEFIGNGGAATALPSNYKELLVNRHFPYRQMVGSLMYAMVSTRPDLAFPIQVVCQFLERPTDVHCNLLKHIFQYCRFN